MRLIVAPVDGLVDEVPMIRVSGAPPSGNVTITARVTDAVGVRHVRYVVPARRPQLGG